jgi:putative serine protease PepD
VAQTERSHRPTIRVGSSPDRSIVGRTVELAAPISVGRHPDCDLPIDDSRIADRHAELSADGEDVRVRDLGSSSGTFVNEQAVIDDRAAPGDRIRVGRTRILVEGGARAEAPHMQVQKRRRRAPRVVVAIVALAAIGLIGRHVVGVGDGTSLIPRLERSTVLIEITDGDDHVLGSGTIIRKDGVILTNDHVAEPVVRGHQLSGPLLVSILTEPDTPAKPMYRARLLASDAYLDVAVLRITATADGHSVSGSSLNLPVVKLGETDELTSGDHLNVTGFPAIGGGRMRVIHYSDGSVSGFVPDDTLDTDRAWVKTNTPLAAGNSGGLAADDDGRIVGIPTAIVDDGRSTISLLRAIDAVKPVIAAALAGRTWVSPYPH